MSQVRRLESQPSQVQVHWLWQGEGHRGGQGLLCERVHAPGQRRAVQVQQKLSSRWCEQHQLWGGWSVVRRVSHLHRGEVPGAGQGEQHHLQTQHPGQDPWQQLLRGGDHTQLPLWARISPGGRRQDRDQEMLGRRVVEREKSQVFLCRLWSSGADREWWI